MGGVLIMDNLFTLMKHLSGEGIETSIHYDKERDQPYLNLNTMAKSHMYLYPDNVVRMRYDKEEFVPVGEIGTDVGINNVIEVLSYLFYKSVAGRDYYNEAWMNLYKKTFGEN